VLCGLVAQYLGEPGVVGLATAPLAVGTAAAVVLFGLHLLYQQR
jgi:hypothetical protein